MVPLAAADLGLSLASAGASWFNAGKQARKQREMTDEQVRRLKLDQARTVGQTELAGAASGIELESESLQTHVANMTAEFRRQAEWMRKAGYAAADGTQTAAGFNLLGDVGGAMFQYGAANNWFRQPSLTPTPSYTPGQGMPIWKP